MTKAAEHTAALRLPCLSAKEPAVKLETKPPRVYALVSAPKSKSLIATHSGRPNDAYDGRSMQVSCACAACAAPESKCQRLLCCAVLCARRDVSRGERGRGSLTLS